MSFSKLAVSASILAVISYVSAHGTVSGIVVDGTYYQGYSPSFQFASPAPVVVGWSSPEDLDNGFVSPAAYSDPDIICHKGATPGQTHAAAKAGSSIDLQWTPWPDSHHGPVIDYLANCHGLCETVDKSTLEFFKIDASGLVDGSTPPGKWASDDLIANNNTWTVKIPFDIAPGNYVLRHEITALHSAGSLDGAQNYPQCFNLAIEGSGTAAPAGVLGTALYKDTDPGIEISIYTPLSSYIIPGPAVYIGGDTPAATSSVDSSSVAGATASPAPASKVSTSASALLASPTAPYSNSTTLAVIAAPVPTTTPVAVPAASTTTTGPDTVIIVSSTVTVIPVAITATPAKPSSNTATPVGPKSSKPTKPSKSTPRPTPEMPAGTTFKTLMTWMDKVVKEIANGNEGLLGRRHARDLGV